jgi:hypothetical protein
MLPIIITAINCRFCFYCDSVKFRLVKVGRLDVLTLHTSSDRTRVFVGRFSAQTSTMLLPVELAIFYEKCLILTQLVKHA